MAKPKTYNPTSLQDVIEICGDIEIPKAKTMAMINIKNFYEGNKEALSARNFPTPGGDLEQQHDDNKHNLILINRVKCVVRAWKALLNADVTREIEECPNREIIAPFIEDYAFTDIAGAWKQNAILYGTAVAAPIYNPDTQEIDVWLPFPPQTVILTSRTSVKDVLAVIEINEGFVQFVSKWGEGIVYDDGKAEVTPRAYSKLPVAIGYGYSRLHERNIEGLSLCTQAIEFSKVETNCAYNVNLLAKQQTRDILAIIGELTQIAALKDNPDIKPGINADGTLILPAGFTAQFLKPDPKLAQSIEVAKHYANLFSSCSGLAIDVIDPSQVANPSNESARIRSTATLHEAKDMVPRWITAEVQLIHSIIYVVDYHASEESPETNFADIKKRSRVVVKNNFQILPTSPNETTQNNISLVAAGLKRRKDAIKEGNSQLSAEEIQEMIDAYNAELEAGNPRAIEQDALKTGAAALTDQQRASKANLE